MGLEAANKPGEVITSGDKLAAGLAETFRPFILDRNGFEDHDAAQASVMPQVTMLEVARAARLDVRTAIFLVGEGVQLKDHSGKKWTVTLGREPKVEDLVYRARRATVLGQAVSTMQGQQRTVSLTSSQA